MISSEQIRWAANAWLRPKGRLSFLRKMRASRRLLDVGCGNNSPYIIKNHLPGVHYTGIDIADCNQTKPVLADSYIVTDPDRFAADIAALGSQFDVVISAHNLEHCNDRDATLAAMLGSLRSGGYLYLSFPCELSVRFPSRSGTLNFYDDPTHQGTPPIFRSVSSRILAEGCEILYSAQCYQPLILRILGMFTEPFSRWLKKRVLGTWEYYGFESIIWAKKN